MLFVWTVLEVVLNATFVKNVSRRYRQLNVRKVSSSVETHAAASPSLKKLHFRLIFRLISMRSMLQLIPPSTTKINVCNPKANHLPSQSYNQIHHQFLGKLNTIRQSHNLETAKALIGLIRFQTSKKEYCLRLHFLNTPCITLNLLILRSHTIYIHFRLLHLHLVRLNRFMEVLWYSPILQQRLDQNRVCC